MNFRKVLSKLINTQGDALFQEIIGSDHIKRLFRMALDSDSAIHILLVGPSASANTMLLTSLMHLKNSYFTDGANSIKAGMTDYVITNNPSIFAC